MSRTLVLPTAIMALLCASPAIADTTFFNTGNPDGKIATASRPGGPGFEIESADDFTLNKSTSITGATFTGLLPSGATPQQVVVEIYRVFPTDSDVGRTSGSPTFSTPNVPTRVNSPSDVAFDSRDSTSGNLTFSTTILSANFSVLNSVQPGGIHPQPNQTTGGNGPVAGEEVQFNITFNTPFNLPADHYFFVPQVSLNQGDFLWLSVAKPIVGGTGPFVPDLQSWTRDAALDPDWLRVGTDIVGAGAFNAAFSLSAVPEPSTWTAVLLGFASLGFIRYRASKKNAASAL